LNEEDLRLVKQIVKEQLYEILETEFYDAFFTMLDAFEAGITGFKQRLASRKGVAEEKPKYDMEKIRWEAAQGSSGAYERSEDVNNPDFKALLKDVQAHGGKMTVGNYFVWTFKNGSALGRKPRKR